MSSNNRLHSIYTVLKRGRYHDTWWRYHDTSSLQLLFCKNILNYKNAWLQLFFYNRKRVIHWMGGCNWNWELTPYLSNTCQRYCIYAIHGCKCSSKKYCIHWGMDAAATFVKKETLYSEKNCSLWLNTVT